MGSLSAKGVFRILFEHNPTNVNFTWTLGDIIWGDNNQATFLLFSGFDRFWTVASAECAIVARATQTVHQSQVKLLSSSDRGGFRHSLVWKVIDLDQFYLGWSITEFVMTSEEKRLGCMCFWFISWYIALLSKFLWNFTVFFVKCLSFIFVNTWRDVKLLYIVNILLLCMLFIGSFASS